MLSNCGFKRLETITSVINSLSISMSKDEAPHQGLSPPRETSFFRSTDYILPLLTLKITAAEKRKPRLIARCRARSSPISLCILSSISSSKPSGADYPGIICSFRRRASLMPALERVKSGPQVLRIGDKRARRSGVRGGRLIARLDPLDGVLSLVSRLFWRRTAASSRSYAARSPISSSKRILRRGLRDRDKDPRGVSLAGRRRRGEGVRLRVACLLAGGGAGDGDGNAGRERPERVCRRTGMTD